MKHSAFPWPVFASIVWGIVSHYIRAYITEEQNDIEREYEKLLKTDV